jgi:Flp pilus assembly protein protease CpaA
MLYVPLAFVLVATVCDVWKRTIPDWIPGLLLVWAVTATAFGFHEVGWLSLVGGLALALVFALPLFALQGMGGGDVKLLAALGAAVGAAAFLGLLLCVALAGGLFGLIAVARGQRDLAYVPAIALGFVLFLAWREGLAHALASP